MSTIGLIGGMSWKSTAEYYRVINERIGAELGKHHSAPCILWSFDFETIEPLQHRGQWDELQRRMVNAGQALQRAGADFLLICTNTMHKMADAVERDSGLPLLHIADATAEHIKAAGVRQVGLLGTRYTMEEDFLRGRLMERHGLEVLTPPGADGKRVHDVIYDELCKGQINAESRAAFRDIIARLADAGCGGVILGCTEIGLLVHDEDSPIPLFDTTIIHAEAAARRSLAER